MRNTMKIPLYCITRDPITQALIAPSPHSHHTPTHLPPHLPAPMSLYGDSQLSSAKRGIPTRLIFHLWKFSAIQKWPLLCCFQSSSCCHHKIMTIVNRQPSGQRISDFTISRFPSRPPRFRFLFLTLCTRGLHRMSQVGSGV